jgi:hypothetical protein
VSKIPDEFSTQGGIERDGIIFVMEGKRKRRYNSRLGIGFKKIEIIKNNGNNEQEIKYD